MGSKSKKNISRRNFLKSSATTVSTAAGATILTGSRTGIFALDATAAETSNVPPLPSRVIGYCGEGDWLGTPPVIPDAKLKATINVDVLVIGGGHAGVLASLGASDKGAKVAVIEKMDEAGFSKAMIPIDEAPFYGCRGQNSGISPAAMPTSSGTFLLGLMTLAGLITDDKLRVLDKKGAPIKGLYVAGNTLGGRYGLGYSTPITGNSIGMAMTHGWLAGKFAAEA